MTNEINALELNDAAEVKPEVKPEAQQEIKPEVKPEKDAAKEPKKESKKSGKDSKAETPEEAQARILEGRTTALKTALEKIEDSFGKGAIMRWGDKMVDSSIEVIPTGCLGLDIALGIGGIPRGRIIEIYGPESSGKTTVTLHIVAEVQRMKGIAAFIDAEHALDPIYARNLGVNIDDLYISQPDNGEQALDIAEDMVRSGAIDLIVIDSVAALTPKSEIEGVMGQAQMGLQARLMSQALRKLTGICSRTRTSIIFTNQLRANLSPYGSPETTTGGRALKFYASVRLNIKRDGDPIKSGDKLIGNHTIVKVAKNKVAPPFKVCTFDIMYGKGISYEGDLLDIGAAEGAINKSGSWYSYNEHSMGQGREPAKAFLRNNPDVCEAVENAVREKNGLKSLTEIRNTPLKDPVTLDIKVRKEKKKSGKQDKRTQTQETAAEDFEASASYDTGDE